MIKNKILRFLTKNSLKKLTIKNFRFTKKISLRYYISTKNLSKKSEREKFLNDYKLKNIKINEFLSQITKNEELLAVNDIIDFLEEIPNSEKAQILKIKEKIEFSKMITVLKKKLEILEKKLIPYSKVDFEEKEKSEDFLLKWVDEQNSRISKNKEKPQIGKLSLILKNLEYLDYEIWQIMEKYLLEEKSQKTFNETVNALEGFTIFRKILENKEKISKKIQNKNNIKFLKSPKNIKFLNPKKNPQNKNLKEIEKSSKNPENSENLKILKTGKKVRNLYKKLEYNMLISILDTNMKYYSRITNSLVKTNSPNLISFKSLENHIMNNLSLDHNLENSFEIYYDFAISNQGSQKLFEQIEVVLYIGANFEYFKTERFLDNFFCDAKKIGKFLEASSFVKNRFFEKEINLNVSKKILKSIENLKNLEGNFFDMKRILNFLPVLELEEKEEKEVILKILEKSEILIGENNCEKEVENFLFFLKGRIQSDFFDVFLLENKNGLERVGLDFRRYLEMEEEEVLLLEAGTLKNTFKKIKSFFI